MPIVYQKVGWRVGNGAATADSSNISSRLISSIAFSLCGIAIVLLLHSKITSTHCHISDCIIECNRSTFVLLAFMQEASSAYDAASLSIIWSGKFSLYGVSYRIPVPGIPTEPFTPRLPKVNLALRGPTEIEKPPFPKLRYTQGSILIRL